MLLHHIISINLRKILATPQCLRICELFEFIARLGATYLVIVVLNRARLIGRDIVRASTL